MLDQEMIREVFDLKREIKARVEILLFSFKIMIPCLKRKKIEKKEKERESVRRR